MPDTAKDLLDRACRDLNPEQRARLLDLAMRLDLEPDDPIWLITIALGQLHLLFEDFPAHLTAFESRLNQWTETNLQTLALLSRKTEMTTTLTTHTHELVTTLQVLTDLSESWRQHSASSTQTLQACVNSLQQDISAIRHSLADLKTSNQHQNTLFQQRLDALLANLSRRTLRQICLFSGLALLTAFSVKQLTGRPLLPTPETLPVENPNPVQKP